MSKIILVFTLVQMMFASCAVASEFKRVPYNLVPSLTVGYAHVEIDQLVSVGRNSTEYVKITSKNNIQAEKNGLKINEYGDAWIWGSELILAVVYSKDGKTIRWRESFENTSQYSAIPKRIYDQLFEISYRSMLKNEGSNFTHLIKVDNKNIFEANIIWNQPNSNPVYNLSEQKKHGIHWTIGIRRIEQVSEKRDGMWEFQKKDDPVVVAVASLLNRFKSAEYDYSKDIEYCGNLCTSEEFNYYRYEYRAGKQKSLFLSSFKDLSSYINNWGETRIIGYIKNGSDGVVYLQPKLRSFKKEDGFDGKFPIVAFSLLKKDGKLLAVPGIKNDFDLMILSNSQVLNSIRSSWK